MAFNLENVKPFQAFRAERHEGTSMAQYNMRQYETKKLLKLTKREFGNLINMRF